MRRNLSGPFRVQDLGQGAWRLTRTAPPDVDVFLYGAEPGADQALGVESVAGIGIDWRADAAVLTLTSADGSRSFKTRSAIIHEPQRRLYEALPLVAFDLPARRFWRRVFRLVRIPGGRYLLRILAGRTRGRR